MHASFSRHRSAIRKSPVSCTDCPPARSAKRLPRMAGVVAEWTIGGLVVLMVGLLCIEVAWWQMTRLRVGVALMEAARAVSRHASSAPRQLDRVMHRAFADAWTSPTSQASACRHIDSPPPCWLLKRTTARPQAPSRSIRLHVHYVFRPLTPMVRGVLQATSRLSRSTNTRAAHAQGRLLISLDIHIENQRTPDRP